MNGEEQHDPHSEPLPDAVTAGLDPDSLKGALGRTGRMLKSAGLPFEEDEFDDELADDDSSSTSSSDES